MGALEVGLEVVELQAPEPAVAIEEAIERGEALALERVDPALAVGRDRDEVGVGEDLQVPRHRRLRQVRQRLDEVARGPRPLEQEIEQRAAAGIGDGGEGVHASTYER